MQVLFGTAMLVQEEYVHIKRLAGALSRAAERERLLLSQAVFVKDTPSLLIPPPPPSPTPRKWRCCSQPLLPAPLARSSSRHILTFRVLLASRNTNASPSPVRTRPRPTKDINLLSTTRDTARHIRDGQIRDGHTRRRGTCGRAVLVVLLDDDAVAGDVGEGDAAVGDAGDGARGVVDGLDAHAVLGVFDCAVFDLDVGDGVVGAAADGA